jgi:hypothetical protein
VEDLFQFRRPRDRIFRRKLAIPSEVSPRVLNEEDFMRLELVDLKDSIGMVTDKPYVFLILDEAGTNGNQAVVGAIPSLNPLPQLCTWVSFQINFLR